MKKNTEELNQVKEIENIIKKIDNNLENNPPHEEKILLTQEKLNYLLAIENYSSEYPKIIENTAKELISLWEEKEWYFILAQKYEKEWNTEKSKELFYKAAKNWSIEAGFKWIELSVEDKDFEKQIENVSKQISLLIEKFNFIELSVYFSEKVIDKGFYELWLSILQNIVEIGYHEYWYILANIYNDLFFEKWLEADKTKEEISDEIIWLYKLSINFGKKHDLMIELLATKYLWDFVVENNKQLWLSYYHKVINKLQAYLNQNQIVNYNVTKLYEEVLYKTYELEINRETRLDLIVELATINPSFENELLEELLANWHYIYAINQILLDYQTNIHNPMIEFYKDIFYKLITDLISKFWIQYSHKLDKIFDNLDKWNKLSDEDIKYLYKLAIQIKNPNKFTDLHDILIDYKEKNFNFNIILLEHLKHILWKEFNNIKNMEKYWKVIEKIEKFQTLNEFDISSLKELIDIETPKIIIYWNWEFIVE